MSQASNQDQCQPAEKPILYTVMASVTVIDIHKPITAAKIKLGNLNMGVSSLYISL